MKPALLFRSGLLALACAVASAAAAQTATVTVSPAAPTTDDAIVVTVSGTWSDACDPAHDATAAVNRAGSAIGVLYTYQRIAGGCAAVLTPWQTTHALGKLPAGTYHVEAGLSQGLALPIPMGTLDFTVTAPRLATTWVPSFRAEGAVTIASRLTAFNNGGGNAAVRVVAAYDPAGRHELSAAALPLAPGNSGALATDALTAETVRFAEVSATTHVTFRASLDRIVGEGSQGRVALPVFDALFPAGATVAAGDIRLNDGFRRANLTLFNAGTADATMQVQVLTEPGNVLAERTVTVPAQSVRQINELIPGDDATIGGAASAWMRITADQPFLAYASATYDATIPYEIYPAH